jgi:hypothetical protein
VKSTEGLYVKERVDDAVNVVCDALTPLVVITTDTLLVVTLLVVGVPAITTLVPIGAVKMEDVIRFGTALE